MITTVLFILVFLAGVIYFWFIKDYRKESLRGQKKKDKPYYLYEKYTRSTMVIANILLKEYGFYEAVEEGLLETISHDEAVEMCDTERVFYTVGIMDGKPCVLLDVEKETICIEHNDEGFFEKIPTYYAEII